MPDLGYYFAPLDYVYGSNVLTNATLTLSSGTVLGAFTPGNSTHGLLLLAGANIVGAGDPLNPARIVRYNMIQEEVTADWSSSNPGASIRTVAGSVLIDRGTNSATAFGLYHFTTTTKSGEETSSTADIGFHYVALTNFDGVYRPVDTDREGLPDYVEDVDGDGGADAGETDFRKERTDGETRDDVAIDLAPP